MNDVDRLVEAVDKLTEEIKRLREQSALYPAPYYIIPPPQPQYIPFPLNPQHIPFPITCNVYGLSPPTTHYTHG